jgi:hypothetical protein
MQDNERGGSTATEKITGSMKAHRLSFPSVWARRMGFGGLIPFVLLALAVWLADPAYRAFAGLALLGYGAVIASFLGAIHWGLVMRHSSLNPLDSPAPLAWGVSPSLVAWVALLLGAAPGLWVVAGLLWACYAADRVLYPRFQVQGWLPMRWTLTVVASASCLLGALGLIR